MTARRATGRDGTRPRGLGRRALLRAAATGAGGAALLGTRAPTATGASTPRPRGRGALPGLPAPAVIGHRGAPGYRPEHTLGSYQLALDLGADLIELDVVPTKDGHLVCRHENDITGTTDVADHPEFAERRTTKTVDGEERTGWFTEDFTLAELKTLKARERVPGRRPGNTLYDDRWRIPAYAEVLDWAREQGRRGRRVRLCTETKHPEHFRALGLELEEWLARLLRLHGLDGADAPLILQSFEPSSMRRMAGLVRTPRLVLLGEAHTRPWDFAESGDRRTVADLVTPHGLREIAGYAQGIGPATRLVIPERQDGTLDRPSALVRDAHAAGLFVHSWTLRNENAFLPREFRRGEDPNAYGDVFGAARAYFETGIDGIFADQPDTALLAAADHRAD